MSKTNFSVIGINNGVAVKVGDGFNQNFETCIRLDDGKLTITLHYGGLDEPLLEVEPAKLAFSHREVTQLITESLEHEWGIEADEGGGSRV
jgi:hypothetical protein